MSVDDETLMAFADGELSGADRAAVEAALASDPALRERLKAHQHLRSRVSAAFDSALSERVPERLSAVAEPREAQVVNLAHRRMRTWSVREWGAMAASIAAGLLIGVGIMNTQTLMTPSSGGLQARGALTRALETRLASDHSGTVRIGLSFASRDGAYCRTFSISRSNTSGLACRQGDGWMIAMTAQGGGGEVRMASAPEPILNAVDAIIVGEPLDRAGEEQARARGWR